MLGTYPRLSAEDLLTVRQEWFFLSVRSNVCETLGREAPHVKICLDLSDVTQNLTQICLKASSSCLTVASRFPRSEMAVLGEAAACLP